MRDLGKWVTMTLRASSRQPKRKTLLSNEYIAGTMSVAGSRCHDETKRLETHFQEQEGDWTQVRSLTCCSCRNEAQSYAHTLP
ncbi:hypothetical protein ALC62_00264 [Cyphomyrmex costatus]|uniref:Uncharacterized protein n=1 Tax=Cyphomyrmex costatus TaxID=456900 RepID=A0A195D7G9_9HYME|nr:hypothetical protein ALC62_00264 [Cyphomyrmex costatus]